MVTTVAKAIGTGGAFSTIQLWESGAPADLTTAKVFSANTFITAAFTQGENLTFTGSGATGKFLDTDSTGVGTGSRITFGVTTGTPAAADVVTGASSGAKCTLVASQDTGIIWQGLARKQTFSSTLQLNGSTSSATCYKHLTTDLGASFRDDPDVRDEPLRYDETRGAALAMSFADFIAIDLNESYARISNFQVKTTSTNGLPLRLGATSPLAENCVVEGTRTNTTSGDGVLVVLQDGTVRNCFAVQTASGAANIVGKGAVGAANFYNCTFVALDDLAVAPTQGVQVETGATANFFNCAMFTGDSTKAVKGGGGTASFTTCYSDISGTTGVTQTNYANTFKNINSIAMDFRLREGSALIDVGATDVTNAFEDIAKTPRPAGAAYDVGAWEFQYGYQRVGPRLRWMQQSTLRW